MIEHMPIVGLEWEDGQSLRVPYLGLQLHCPDLDEEGMNRCFPITVKHNLRFCEPPYTRPVRTVVCEAHRGPMAHGRLHD